MRAGTLLVLLVALAPCGQAAYAHYASAAEDARIFALEMEAGGREAARALEAARLGDFPGALADLTNLTHRAARLDEVASLPAEDELKARARDEAERLGALDGSATLVVSLALATDVRRPAMAAQEVARILESLDALDADATEAAEAGRHVEDLQAEIASLRAFLRGKPVDATPDAQADVLLSPAPPAPLGSRVLVQGVVVALELRGNATLLLDGAPVASSPLGPLGQVSFAFEVPLDPARLGTHELRASADAVGDLSGPTPLHVVRHPVRLTVRDDGWPRGVPPALHLSSALPAFKAPTGENLSALEAALDAPHAFERLTPEGPVPYPSPGGPTLRPPILFRFPGDAALDADEVRWAPGSVAGPAAPARPLSAPVLLAALGVAALAAAGLALLWRRARLRRAPARASPTNVPPPPAPAAEEAALPTGLPPREQVVAAYRAARAWTASLAEPSWTHREWGSALAARLGREAPHVLAGDYERARFSPEPVAPEAALRALAAAAEVQEARP